MARTNRPILGRGKNAVKRGKGWMVQNSQQNQKPAHTEYPHRISTLFRSYPSKCYTKREWFVLSSVFGIRSVGETSPFHLLMPMLSELLAEVVCDM